MAAAGVFASHHIGQAGRTVEAAGETRGWWPWSSPTHPQAERGLPGREQDRPMMGTNPLAFAAPVPGRAPLVIDLALSLVARAKIVAAQKAGQADPRRLGQ